MNENRYFAKDGPEAFERERLALLTQVVDPITTRRLTNLGVESGWRCLELAAGDGSVARWLAQRVGPDGRVVATDLNPRFLGGHRFANLLVRRHNILEDELESAHYDLAHCRFLLEHLSDPSRAIRRLVDAVRPGGWLLLEAGDAISYTAADPKHPRAAGFNRISQALFAAMQATGTIDFRFGRLLPALAEKFGIQVLGHDGVALTGRGGGATARFFQMTGELLRDGAIAAGCLTDADFEERKPAYEDPSFWFVGLTVFGVWGRRAGS
jgi:2-polyprenyl-3-methyl-5-hydroxy-6-metoxy-1,4-benzoquinol methylase